MSATVPLLWRHYVSATSLVFGGLSKKIKKQKNKSQPLRPASFAFPPRPFFHWNPCPEEGGGATAAVFTVCRPSRGVWRPCVCHPQTSQAAVSFDYFLHRSSNPFALPGGYSAVLCLPSLQGLWRYPSACLPFSLPLTLLASPVTATFVLQP